MYCKIVDIATDSRSIIISTNLIHHSFDQINRGEGGFTVITYPCKKAASSSWYGARVKKGINEDEMLFAFTIVFMNDIDVSSTNSQMI
mmetsp:Transcript_2283/g.3178  ORF Transcript_2283/g.3178 Transcript_2283/m.3178 type:complete len:88 (-) Transcript_2283:131-394(-)